MTASRSQSGQRQSGQRSQLVKRLASALADDARAEVELAVRVGVAASLGLTQREIAERLEATPQQVRASFERLKRVADRVEL